MTQNTTPEQTKEEIARTILRTPVEYRTRAQWNQLITFGYVHIVDEPLSDGAIKLYKETAEFLALAD